jgi:hypothetical protein
MPILLTLRCSHSRLTILPEIVYYLGGQYWPKAEIRQKQDEGLLKQKSNVGRHSPRPLANYWHYLFYSS